MRKKIKTEVILFISFFLFVQGNIADCGQKDQKSNTRILSLEEFVSLAATKDTGFEKILIDEMALQYKKDLNLSARDLVLSVKGQYDFFLSQNREEPETKVSLSKLFPSTATDLSAEYKTTPSFSSNANSSEFSLTASQDIAENAFGKVYRFKDKIIGLEIDIARYQIVEAYEDYFATLITAYYNWYEAYENVKIGESSYNENLKLLQNIKERETSKIALPIDVNKVSLQVIVKKEKLVNLKEEYQNSLNIVKNAIRYDEDSELIPEYKDTYKKQLVSFEKEYEIFKEKSRTHNMLDLLEEKSSIEVDKNADELMPSIKVLLGYKVKGDDYEITEEDNMLYTGVSMDWPLGDDQVGRAEYETSKVQHRKVMLGADNTRHKLLTEIKNLYAEINRERKLVEIAAEKVNLSRSVVVDETENYSFGKVTLNDYISAVNVLDNNKFNKVLHDVLLNKLIIEWLRKTDQLIEMDEILSK